MPAAAVMTEPFRSAAELMGRVLGAPGYPFVVIPHPLSSAVEAELEERAREAVRQARQLLLAG